MITYLERENEKKRKERDVEGDDCNTSIISIARYEAGLVTVLGHEMPHATSRHSGERIFKSELTLTCLGGVQGSLSQMDPVQRQVLIGLLSVAAKYGSTLPFSRKQEAEANHIGLLYMTRYWL